jgi:hypothetical protein
LRLNQKPDKDHKNLKSEAKPRFCAEEEIRTLTPFRALPPQSSASTSFATSALLVLVFSVEAVANVKKIFEDFFLVPCLLVPCLLNLVS